MERKIYLNLYNLVCPSQDTSQCTNVKNVLIRLTLRLNFEPIYIIFKSKTHLICTVSYRKLNYKKWTQVYPSYTRITWVGAVYAFLYSNKASFYHNVIKAHWQCSPTAQCKNKNSLKKSKYFFCILFIVFNFIKDIEKKNS